MNSEAMQKPVADEEADDADRRIADEAKFVAPHNLARQPSGNEANDQNDDQSLVRPMYGLPLALRSDSSSPTLQRNRSETKSALSPRARLGRR